jgi:hypothetical protein
MSQAATRPRIQPNPAPDPNSVPLADCSPAEQAERRCLAALDALVAEAWQQRTLETLVDSLAWTLARVVVGLDSQYVMGDVLRRLGNYTCRLAESRRAEDEAEQEKKEGRAPH